MYAIEESRLQIALIGADSILEDSQRRMEKYGNRSAKEIKLDTHLVERPDADVVMDCIGRGGRFNGSADYEDN